MRFLGGGLLLLFLVSSIFGLSRDDLFKQAFGKTVAQKPYTADFSFMGDEQPLGVASVLVTPFSSEYKIVAQELSDLLEELQDQAGLTNLMLEADEEGYVSTEKMKELGYEITANKTKRTMALITPIETRKLKSIDVKEEKDADRTNYYKPEIMSGFVNIMGAHTVDHFSDKADLGGFNINGALNVRRTVFRFSGTEQRGSNRLGESFVWRNAMFFRNFEGNDTRVTVGSQEGSYNNARYESLPIWGAGYGHIAFIDRQNRGAKRYVDYTFFIEKDSFVDIIINGEYFRSYDMRAGRHSFNRIPLDDGINKIVFDFTDIETNESYRQEKFTELHDANLLKKGEARYIFGIGVTANTQLDRLVLNSRQPMLNIVGKYGWLNTVNLEPFVQGDGNNFLIGSNVFWAQYIGRTNIDVAFSKFGGNVGSNVNYTLGSYFLDETGLEEEEISPIKAWNINARFFTPGFSTFSGTESILYQFNFTIERHPSEIKRTQYTAALGRATTGESTMAYNVANTILASETKSLTYTYGINYANASFLPTLGINQRINNREKGITKAFSLTISDGFAFTYSVTKQISGSPNRISYELSQGGLGHRYNYRGSDENETNVLIDTQLAGNQSIAAVYKAGTEASNFTGNTALLSSDGDRSRADNFQFSSTRGTLTVDYEDSLDSQLRTTSIRYGTALAFAGNTVAMSAPIRNSFLIIRPHNALKDNKILVNDTFTNDVFGPMVINTLNDGIPQQFFIDSPDADTWQDLGKQTYRVKPGEFEGYFVKFGKAGSHIALVAFRNKFGQAIELVPVEIQAIETELEFDDTTSMVGRNGVLIIQGLVKGKFRIVFTGSKYGDVIFTVKDGDPGFIRLGKFTIGEEETIIGEDEPSGGEEKTSE